MKEAHTIVHVPLHLYTPTALRRNPQPTVRIGAAYQPKVIITTAWEGAVSGEERERRRQQWDLLIYWGTRGFAAGVVLTMLWLMRS
jgi:hypothetical protein